VKKKFGDSCIQIAFISQLSTLKGRNGGHVLLSYC